MLTSVLALSIQANEEYLIKYTVEPQPNSIIMVNWQSTSPYYTSWQSIGEVYGCSNWTPDESTIQIGQSFTQERTCAINQERFRQDRELSSKGSSKDVGTPQLETRVEAVLQSRSSSGILESWVAIGALYGDWSNSGNLYDCTNWTPDPSTIDNGVSFTQNATDCKQNQTRTKQDREQETTTLATRNVGSEIIENQTLTNQSNSRNSVGTKVNRVCLFDQSFNPYVYIWVTGNSDPQFMTSIYQNIPSLWIDIDTGTKIDIMGIDGETESGLTKISNDQFNYNDGSKIWKITRGSYSYSANGYNYYQVCFQ